MPYPFTSVKLPSPETTGRRGRSTTPRPRSVRQKTAEITLATYARVITNRATFEAEDDEWMKWARPKSMARNTSLDSPWGLVTDPSVSPSRSFCFVTMARESLTQQPVPPKGSTTSHPDSDKEIVVFDLAPTKRPQTPITHNGLLNLSRTRVRDHPAVTVSRKTRVKV